jgi:Rieske Fe-S protein
VGGGLFPRPLFFSEGEIVKRRNFIFVALGIVAQLPLEAIAATKKPTPKATAKPKPNASTTPKPQPASTSATPTPKPTPAPQLLPVKRNGELIKIESLVAPTSFYASVEKNQVEYPLLITKPTERTLKIFTARCPHQGTILNLPNSGAFTCDRHGATFNEITGKVTGGPTIQNLVQYEIIEREGSIYIIL